MGVVSHMQKCQCFDVPEHCQFYIKWPNIRLAKHPLQPTTEVCYAAEMLEVLMSFATDLQAYAEVKHLH